MKLSAATLLFMLLLGVLALGAAACRAVPLFAEPTQQNPTAVVVLATGLPARSPTLLPTPTATLTPSPLPPTPTTTSTPRPTASPRQQQVFEELWEVVNEEYLYPDFNGQDWDRVYQEMSDYIATGLTYEEFYLAMAEAVASLGDEHSTFFTPAEVREEDAQYAGDNEFVGIGVLNISVPERQRVTIVLVYPNSPAERAGLKAHDNILAVDGEPILNEDGTRRDLLRGEAGSQVSLTIQTPGEEPREIVLTRERVRGEMPVPYEVLKSPQGKRIGYIFIPTFNDSRIDEQVGKALRAMTDSGRLDGMILDNRQNDGGVLTELTGTIAYFTHGVLGHFVNRQERESLHVLGQNINGSQQIPLVVLIGPGTVSFGEIFAGILQDNGRAYVIGETTGGNVEILWVYNFSDGSRAWIAHDTFVPANNPEANWEETGVIPDRITPGNWDEITPKTDPAIKAALRHFDGSKP